MSRWGWAVMSREPAAFMSYVRFNDHHDDGQLTQLRALDDLDVYTELERRPALVRVAERNGSTVLAFEGKELAFPAHARDEVCGTLELDEPFTAADLPGELDDEGRLVLVRRLVREGLLRISGV